MKNPEKGTFNLDPSRVEYQPVDAEWQGPLTEFGQTLHEDHNFGREEANEYARREEYMAMTRRVLGTFALSVREEKK